MESHISTFQCQSSSDSLGKSIGPEFRRFKFKSWLDFNMTHLVRSLITSFLQSPLKEVGKIKKKVWKFKPGPQYFEHWATYNQQANTSPHNLLHRCYWMLQFYPGSDSECIITFPLFKLYIATIVFFHAAFWLILVS